MDNYKRQIEPSCETVKVAKELNSVREKITIQISEISKCEDIIQSHQLALNDLKNNLNKLLEIKTYLKEKHNELLNLTGNVNENEDDTDCRSLKVKNELFDISRSNETASSGFVDITPISQRFESYSSQRDQICSGKTNIPSHNSVTNTVASDNISQRTDDESNMNDSENDRITVEDNTQNVLQLKNPQLTDINGGGFVPAGVTRNELVNSIMSGTQLSALLFPPEPQPNNKRQQQQRIEVLERRLQRAISKIKDLEGEVEKLTTERDRCTASAKAFYDVSIDPDDYTRIVRKNRSLEIQLQEVDKLLTEEIRDNVRLRNRPEPEPKEQRTIGTQWLVADYKSDEAIKKAHVQKNRKKLKCMLRKLSKQ